MIVKIILLILLCQKTLSTSLEKEEFDWVGVGISKDGERNCGRDYDIFVIFRDSCICGGLYSSAISLLEGTLDMLVYSKYRTNSRNKIIGYRSCFGVSHDQTKVQFSEFPPLLDRVRNIKCINSTNILFSEYLFGTRCFFSEKYSRSLYIVKGSFEHIQLLYTRHFEDYNDIILEVYDGVDQYFSDDGCLHEDLKIYAHVKPDHPDYTYLNDLLVQSWSSVDEGECNYYDSILYKIHNVSHIEYPDFDPAKKRLGFRIGLLCTIGVLCLGLCCYTACFAFFLFFWDVKRTETDTDNCIQQYYENQRFVTLANSINTDENIELADQIPEEVGFEHVPSHENLLEMEELSRMEKRSINTIQRVELDFMVDIPCPFGKDDDVKVNSISFGTHESPSDILVATYHKKRLKFTNFIHLLRKDDDDVGEYEHIYISKISGSEIRIHLLDKTKKLYVVVRKVAEMTKQFLSPIPEFNHALIVQIENFEHEEHRTGKLWKEICKINGDFSYFIYLDPQSLILYGESGVFIIKNRQFSGWKRRELRLLFECRSIRSPLDSPIMHVKPRQVENIEKVMKSSSNRFLIILLSDVDAASEERTFLKVDIYARIANPSEVIYRNRGGSVVDALVYGNPQNERIVILYREGIIEKISCENGEMIRCFHIRQQNRSFLSGAADFFPMSCLMNLETRHHESESFTVTSFNETGRSNYETFRCHLISLGDAADNEVEPKLLSYDEDQGTQYFLNPLQRFSLPPGFRSRIVHGGRMVLPLLWITKTQMSFFRFVRENNETVSSIFRNEVDGYGKNKYQGRIAKLDERERMTYLKEEFFENECFPMEDFGFSVFVFGRICDVVKAPKSLF